MQTVIATYNGNAFRVVHNAEGCDSAQFLLQVKRCGRWRTLNYGTLSAIFSVVRYAGLVLDTNPVPVS